MNNIINSKLWIKFRNNKQLYKAYRNTIGNLVRRYRLIDKKRAVREHGEANIKELHAILNKTSLVCFVDGGTLLGFVREGKILKWDFDVDFGIVIKDTSTWNILENNLVSFGYKKIRQFSLDGLITEQTYTKDEMSIDFFGHFNYDDYSLQYAYYNPTNNPTDEMAVKEFKTIPIKNVSVLKLENISVNIPNDVDIFLSDSYGPNWKIPDPKWDDSNSPGMRILTDKKGIKEEF